MTALNNRWMQTGPWMFGWAALAIPSLWDYLFGDWKSYSQGHELLLLSVAAWLVARQLRSAPIRQQNSDLTWAHFGLAFGLLAYLFGRTQEFIRIELLALWWLSQMVVCIVWGVSSWRRAWFAWLFILFALPLPFAWVLALTAPLKEAVSWMATQLMAGLGYPVARTGVVVTVGQYQLLVAEACAGLHSMFVLEAMGLLYSHLMQHASWWRNVTLAVLAIPVSFMANVVRVVVLMLVTFHFGDAHGQGFAHQFAGVLLFAIALLLMACLDWLLGMIWPDGPTRSVA